MWRLVNSIERRMRRLRKDHIFLFFAIYFTIKLIYFLLFGPIINQGVSSPRGSPNIDSPSASGSYNYHFNTSYNSLLDENHGRSSLELQRELAKLSAVERERDEVVTKIELLQQRLKLSEIDKHREGLISNIESLRQGNRQSDKDYSNNEKKSKKNDVDVNNEVATSPTATPLSSENILIIATVPFSLQSVLALWTHLECLTDHIDHVQISAPDTDWSRHNVQLVIKEFERARSKDGRSFATTPDSDGHTAGEAVGDPVDSATKNIGHFTIDASFHLNDRYDVGLWCDALSMDFHYDGVQFRRDGLSTPDNVDYNGLQNRKANDWNSMRPRSIFLINDSVYIMRNYNDLTLQVMNATQQQTEKEQSDAEKQKQKQMKLLDEKQEKLKQMINVKTQEPDKLFFGLSGDFRFDEVWLESVYRGFTPKGLQTFYNHSCTSHAVVTANCSDTNLKKMKRCIVIYYEKDLAKRYQRDQLKALFPTSPNFKTMKLIGTRKNRSWIYDSKYFHYIKTTMGFPVSKTRFGEDPSVCSSRMFHDKKKGQQTKLLMEEQWKGRLMLPETMEMLEHIELMRKTLLARQLLLQDLRNE